MADALVISGLSKRFGGLRAVQDVSFTVKENETDRKSTRLNSSHI